MDHRIMNEKLRGGVKGGHSAVISGYPPSNMQRPEVVVEVGEREHWPKGLTNVGNTCYANATLQCLLSTALTSALLDPRTMPIIRRYSSNPNLLAMGSGSVDSADEDKTVTTECENEKQRKEREKRKIHENCEWLTKELTVLTQEYVSMPASSRPRGSSAYMSWLSTSDNTEGEINPGGITRHPDRLSPCLRPYQQEDAHEFLRALLSTLVMNGKNKQLSSLFDGLLESAVTCQTCGRSSLTRDRYMDLSLDINDPDISTLDDALYEYTKTEILDEDNAVFCNKCERKQSVTKGLRLATAPSILVCHLKRFAFDHYGRLVRLHKKVKFPLRLEIEEFMSTLNKSRPPPYDLVGLLVHQGQTCASGHYLAFVKKNGEWYKCNDSTVTKVAVETVLDQQAYILMYEVAGMRVRSDAFGAPRLRRQTSSEKSLDDDRPEASGDDFSTLASCTTGERSRHSRHSTDSSAPVDRLLNFISDAESGITSFLADMCCDSTNNGVNEPSTKQMKRRNARRRKDSSGSPSRSRDRSLSSEGVKVIEVDRKNPPSNYRSQTAPRQRIHSDSFDPTMDIESPHTSHSTRSEKMHRKKKDSKKDARNKRQRSRSIHKPAAGERHLPPLPNSGRPRRAKSNGPVHRKGGGYLV